MDPQVLRLSVRGPHTEYMPMAWRPDKTVSSRLNPPASFCGLSPFRGLTMYRPGSTSVLERPTLFQRGKFQQSPPTRGLSPSPSPGCARIEHTVALARLNLVLLPSYSSQVTNYEPGIASLSPVPTQRCLHQPLTLPRCYIASPPHCSVMWAPTSGPASFVRPPHRKIDPPTYLTVTPELTFHCIDPTQRNAGGSPSGRRGSRVVRAEREGFANVFRDDRDG
ncbi:hypothetical protein B0H17DRAFT_1063439 [Mycena rosella]|uniref:Uncharacterized protein n=1 Tax=Mycena rosella TaxID=1033263 RepID=A0AAD7GHM6_MYCRO|nr:hypothetical protein B0H17DRAFT_1063439 [Mycena rosella]